MSFMVNFIKFATLWLNCPALSFTAQYLVRPEFETSPTGRGEPPDDEHPPVRHRAHPVRACVFGGDRPGWRQVPSKTSSPRGLPPDSTSPPDIHDPRHRSGRPDGHLRPIIHLHRSVHFLSSIVTSYDVIEIPEVHIYRVRTGPGSPGKSLNFRKSFSRPGKSWNSDTGPGKSWKSELGYIFLIWWIHRSF